MKICVGNTVRLKKGSRQEAKVLMFYSDVSGGVKLDRPIGGHVSWNIDDLEKAPSSRSKAIVRNKLIRSRIKSLTFAYEKYMKLLGAELDEIAPLASAHGWKSSRYEEGKQCRARIKNCKSQFLQTRM